MVRRGDGELIDIFRVQGQAARNLCFDKARAYYHLVLLTYQSSTLLLAQKSLWQERVFLMKLFYISVRHHYANISLGYNDREAIVNFHQWLPVMYLSMYQRVCDCPAQSLKSLKFDKTKIKLHSAIGGYVASVVKLYRSIKR